MHLDHVLEFLNILLVVLCVPVAPCGANVLGLLLLINGNGIPFDMRVCEMANTTIVSKGLVTRLLGDGHYLSKDILRVLLLLLLLCGRSCPIVCRLTCPRGRRVVVGMSDTVCLILEMLLEQPLAILFVLELPNYARVIFPRHLVSFSLG